MKSIKYNTDHLMNLTRYDRSSRNVPISTIYFIKNTVTLSGYDISIVTLKRVGLIHYRTYIIPIHYKHIYNTCIPI